MAEEDDDECSNGPGPSGLSNGNLRHHRMNRMCGNDPYDNETAVSIFTNAPKVTRRALAPHSSSRATAQEEDTNAYNGKHLLFGLKAKQSIIFSRKFLLFYLF